MADPISVASFTIQLVKVSQSIYGLIKSVKNVPDELLALHNEIADLRLIFDSIRDVENHAGHKLGSSHDNSTTAEVFRYQASIKLNEIDALLSEWGRLSPFGDRWHLGRTKRFLWLKEGKRVAALQNDLREIRTNICTAYTVRNL